MDEFSGAGLCWDRYLTTWAARTISATPQKELNPHHQPALLPQHDSHMGSTMFW